MLYFALSLLLLLSIGFSGFVPVLSVPLPKAPAKVQPQGEVASYAMVAVGNTTRSDEPAEKSTPALQAVTHSAQVAQGHVLKLSIPAAQPKGLSLEGATAWFAGKQSPVYKQETGDYLALSPVPVRLDAREYPLLIQTRTGATVYRGKVVVTDAHLTHQNIQVSKGMKSLEPSPGEMEAIEALKSRTTPTRFWSEPFMLPTPQCMNSPFGVLRFYNGKYTGNYHKGIDLRSPMGQPVKAATGGIVRVANLYNFHGGTVGIDHGQGVVSLYIHLSKVTVTVGQTVNRGDVVGEVGSTGFSTGPHLHWGVYVNSMPVSPLQWVRAVPAC